MSAFLGLLEFYQLWKDHVMAEVQSCGFIIVRRDPELAFLLMKHPHRWDLPKGHVDKGETEMECALRELNEETGIAAEDIAVDDRFRFTHEYDVFSRRLNRTARKELVVFLAWLEKDVEIRPTEHGGFQWFPWSPPHEIQAQTIDPLLQSVENHFERVGQGGDSKSGRNR